MKNLINYAGSFFLIALVVLFQACESDETIVEPNRCGYPDVVVRENHDFDSLFSDDIDQLSAGSISGSLALPDGKTLWFVNYALLNTTGGKVPLSNSVIVQSGDQIEVKYEATGGQAKSLIPDPAADRWYTVNNGVANNGAYELIVSTWQRTGSGAYDFVHTGVSVVVVSATDFSIQSVNVISVSSDIVLGSAILQEDDFTYIYGAKNRGFTKEAFVARTPAGSLLQSWSYFDGEDWKINLTDARPIVLNVSDSYSVFESDGLYFLVSQASVFGEAVSLYVADTPSGEWWFDKILYCRSEGDDALLSANSVVHVPSYKGDNLLGSYSLVDRDLQSAQPYEPVFIEISNWR